MDENNPIGFVDKLLHEDFQVGLANDITHNDISASKTIWFEESFLKVAHEPQVVLLRVRHLMFVLYNQIIPIDERKSKFVSHEGSLRLPTRTNPTHNQRSAVPISFDHPDGLRVANVFINTIETMWIEIVAG